MTRHVAVLLGGWSAEREVSLSSGRACADALEQAGFRVTRIDVQRDLPALMAALDPKPDVIFNALHGRGGEDGLIQGVLAFLGIPFTHSGILASALAMNKAVSRLAFQSAGIPVAEGRVVSREDVLAGHVMDPPYVLKPIDEGSSVGVEIVRPGSNHPTVEAETWRFGERVLVERYIPGRELTVGVMENGTGPRAMTVTEIRPTVAFYDYAAKYTDGLAVHDVPARLPEEVSRACRDYAVLAHRTLGCRGISRADFRYDDSKPGLDGLVMLEVNTQPGMTPLSLVPEQAAHLGMSFVDLCVWIVENASCDA